MSSDVRYLLGSFTTVVDWEDLIVPAPTVIALFGELTLIAGGADLDMLIVGLEGLMNASKGVQTLARKPEAGKDVRSSSRLTEKVASLLQSCGQFAGLSESLKETKHQFEKLRELAFHMNVNAAGARGSGQITRVQAGALDTLSKLAIALEHLYSFFTIFCNSFSVHIDATLASLRQTAQSFLSSNGSASGFEVKTLEIGCANILELADAMSVIANIYVTLYSGRFEGALNKLFSPPSVPELTQSESDWARNFTQWANQATEWAKEMARRTDSEVTVMRLFVKTELQNLEAKLTPPVED
ncbi:hypothetical protein FRB90_000142 [Tulasnella sp. 427]|nr:hypothetical protein FRB90_000142 [Tulasnella sp. 427]